MVKSAENHIARWWKKAENSKGRCFLCPRNCLINEGERGFCFVRQNIAGELVAAAYGRASGFCVDPIEKKPLYHFYPGISILSFGTIGCNLGCKFCQNWDISKPKDLSRLGEYASPKDVAAAAKAKCNAVAFTYNEPIVCAEYTIDTAKECRTLGVKAVAVTAGYISEQAREEFFEHMDAANVDLKAFTERFYEKFCLSKLQPVLDTLVYIKKKTKTWLEITNLVIPGENDSENEIKALSKWIAENLGKEVPLHFSAFYPCYQMLDAIPTPKETLFKARAIAMAQGLKYVYTGNVYDPQGSCTYCKNCGKVVIKREGYSISEYRLKNGKCEFCGTPCDGVFSPR